MSEPLIRAIGGAPMIAPHVDTGALFSLACEKRRRIDGSSRPASHYASPLEASAVYRRVSGGRAVDEYPSSDVEVDGLQKISDAIFEIIEAVPEWASYFAVPIRWRLLTIPGVDGDTAPHIPQSIFLSENIFASKYALREQIVHEMSHVWLGLTLEITPWARDSDVDFVLPSGTGNKKIWQVILALGFAVSAVKLYRGLIAKGGDNTRHIARMNWATSYALGCIKIARNSGLLTDNGAEIVNSCDRELCFVSV